MQPLHDKREIRIISRSCSIIENIGMKTKEGSFGKYSRINKDKEPIRTLKRILVEIKCFPIESAMKRISRHIFYNKEEYRQAIA